MSFVSNLARALTPLAVVATIAAPAAAATSGELKAVEASLAATQSMTANFLQTDGKGRQMAGTLSLKRPGKIRFAYGGGVNMLLVANGKTLNFIDYDVGQKSSWPIAKSPLAVLLSPNPDLDRIARIMPSDHKSVVVVRARDVSLQPGCHRCSLVLIWSIGVVVFPERRVRPDARGDHDQVDGGGRPAEGRSSG